MKAFIGRWRPLLLGDTGGYYQINYHHHFIQNHQKYSKGISVRSAYSRFPSAVKIDRN